MTAVWVLKESPQILFEDIDGFVVCYCASTGQTHILDAFPAEIFRSLLPGPLGVREIEQRLAGLLEEEVDWSDKINEVLLGLNKLQLIDIQPA